MGAETTAQILSSSIVLDSFERQRRRLTRLLVFVLLYTTLAGAVRKWVLLGGPVSNALLLGQILIPWLFYLIAPGRRRQYLPLLLISGSMLVLMALNPLNQTLYHGALGLLLHMGWWLMVFHYLENKSLYCWDRLYGLAWVILIVEIGLSIAQYSLPRMHFINRYAVEGPVSIAYVGEAARVTGTFSFVSGYTAWLLFLNLWTWSVAVWKRQVWLVTGLVAVGVLASLLSGGRMSLAITLAFALFSYAHLLRRVAFHRLLVVFGLGLAVGAWVFQRSDFLQQSWANFASRIEDGFRDAEYGRRTWGAVEEVVNFRGDFPLFGAGLGGTYQGARALWGESYYMLRYGGYEEEPERIVLEGGYLLLLWRCLLLWIFLRGLMLSHAMRWFLFFLIVLFVPVVFNTYNLVFVALGLSAVDWSFRHIASKPISP